MAVAVVARLILLTVHSKGAIAAAAPGTETNNLGHADATSLHTDEDELLSAIVSARISEPDRVTGVLSELRVESSGHLGARPAGPGGVVRDDGGDADWRCRARRPQQAAPPGRGEVCISRCMADILGRRPAQGSRTSSGGIELEDGAARRLHICSRAGKPAEINERTNSHHIWGQRRRCAAATAKRLLCRTFMYRSFAQGAPRCWH